MKKLLVLLLGLAFLPLSGFAAVTHFTETLPPAQTAGCMPVANGYDWVLTCNSPAQPQTFNGATTQLSTMTISQTVIYGVSSAGSLLNLSSFSTIVPNTKYMNIGSSGLVINMAGAGSNNLPVIATATATAGQEIVLTSTQSISTVVLTSGAAAGLDLGSATRTLANGKALGLYFNATTQLWTEMFFGSN